MGAVLGPDDGGDRGITTAHMSSEVTKGGHGWLLCHCRAEKWKLGRTEAGRTSAHPSSSLGSSHSTRSSVRQQ